MCWKIKLKWIKSIPYRLTCMYARTHIDKITWNLWLLTHRTRLLYLYVCFVYLWENVVCTIAKIIWIFWRVCHLVHFCCCCWDFSICLFPFILFGFFFSFQMPWIPEIGIFFYGICRKVFLFSYSVICDKMAKMNINCDDGVKKIKKKRRPITTLGIAVSTMMIMTKQTTDRKSNKNFIASIKSGQCNIGLSHAFTYGRKCRNWVTRRVTFEGEVHKNTQNWTHSSESWSSSSSVELCTKNGLWKFRQKNQNQNQTLIYHPHRNVTCNILYLSIMYYIIHPQLDSVTRNYMHSIVDMWLIIRCYQWAPKKKFLDISLLAK